jgi:hypothetical protein
MSYLDIANEWERKQKRAQTIDGHKVKEIIWETSKAIVFRDEDGKMWRRVHAWGMTWPVEISGSTVQKA